MSHEVFVDALRDLANMLEQNPNMEVFWKIDRTPVEPTPQTEKLTVVYLIEKHTFRANHKPELSFTVYASDKLASGLVRYWAGAARASGATENTVERALDIAKAMEAWPNRKYPK